MDYIKYSEIMDGIAKDSIEFINWKWALVLHVFLVVASFCLCAIIIWAVVLYADTSNPLVTILTVFGCLALVLWSMFWAGDRFALLVWFACKRFGNGE